MRLLLLDIERNFSVEGTSMLVDQGLRLNAYNFSKVKDDIQVVFLLSCYVEHLVDQGTNLPDKPLLIYRTEKNAFKIVNKYHL